MGQGETSIVFGHCHIAALPTQPKRPICWYVQQLGAETQTSVDRPGERTQFGCSETAWEAWSVVWPATGGVPTTECGSTVGASGREGHGLALAVTFHPAYSGRDSTTRSSRSWVPAGSPRNGGRAELWGGGPSFSTFQDLCECSTWGTSKPTSGVPTAEAGPAGLAGADTGRQVTLQSMPPGGQDYSVSFPSRSTLHPPTSHHCLEPNVRASISPTSKQILPPRWLWWPWSKEEAPLQHSVQALITSNTHHSPYQLVKGQHTLRKDQASTPRTNLTPRTSDSHRRPGDAPT